MVPDDHRRGVDDDDEARASAWSSPRPTPGAMGAAHDDLFGVPSSGEKGDPAADDAATQDADTEADVEVDATGGRDSADAGGRPPGRRGAATGRSVGAEDTEIEGRSETTDPDGDGSRASQRSAGRGSAP